MPFHFPFYPYYYNRFSPHRQYPTKSQRTDNNFASHSSNVNNNLHYSNSYDSNSASNANGHTSSTKDYSSNTENSNNHSDDRSLADDGDEKCIFEIFGLKLFFDDILILCILFFLYNEEVKDYELFLCLILLLIT